MAEAEVCVVLVGMLSLFASCAHAFSADLQMLYNLGGPRGRLQGDRVGLTSTLARRRDQDTPLRITSLQDLINIPTRHRSQSASRVEAPEPQVVVDDRANGLDGDVADDEGSSPYEDGADDGADDRADGLVDDRAHGLVDDRAHGLVDDRAHGLVDDRAHGLVDDRAHGLVDDRAHGLVDDRAHGLVDDRAGSQQNASGSVDGGMSSADIDDNDVQRNDDYENGVGVSFRRKKSNVEDTVEDLEEEEEEDDDDDDDDDDDGGLAPRGTLARAGMPPPFWHHPCGRSVDLVVKRPRVTKAKSVRSVSRRINRALERVWRQLNMTVLHYHLQRFDKLYYQVLIGVNENHYVPSWVPDKDDLPKLTIDDIKSSSQLANELSMMHTHLQKFSVALEQISDDNRRNEPLRHNALSKIKNYVKMLLCEVEWALLSLALPLPQAVDRDIMSPEERNMPDNTNRQIRDWGVLVKYRDFLAGWGNIVGMLSSHVKPDTTRAESGHDHHASDRDQGQRTHGRHQEQRTQGRDLEQRTQGRDLEQRTQGRDLEQRTQGRDLEQRTQGRERDQTSEMRASRQSRSSRRRRQKRV